jgi:hypothetical protein
MYQLGKAKVRIHGEADREKLTTATERFMKQIHKRSDKKCPQKKSVSTIQKKPN